MKILLPFSDDSTLFFALRMRDVLASTTCQIDLAWLTDRTALSYRQLDQNLPQGPDLILLNTVFETPEVLSQYDAIVTSRIYGPLRDMMKKVHIRASADRPVIVSFQGGLDFDPMRGFANRRHADAVFIVPATDIPAYQDFRAENNFGWQHLDFGHPTFLHPEDVAKPAGIEPGRNVYFFAQAISPRTQKSRLHVLRMLVVLARKDPGRDIIVKLRHLPHENQTHLHRERYDYPALLAQLDAPANLKLSDCTMDEAIADAGLGITCTSTAAIDLIRQGVPTAIYLDYVENYLDPLMPQMRALFEGSGLITPLQDLLEERIASPDPDWLETMFCRTDLGPRVITAIEAAKKRPLQVTRLLTGVDTT